jgi:trimeric autotransporter adhesin
MKWLCVFLFILSSPIVDAQIITTFAGGGLTAGTSNVPATAVKLSDPCGGAFDKYGNYYFCEAIGGHRARKVDPSGIITTIAGTGVGGFSGDGGLATAAQLNGPFDVYVDQSDNIFISDGQNFRIRKIDAITGIISTVAGNGIGGYSGDGLPATSASISNAPGIFVDKHGSLFIADFGNARVRKVNSAGIISTFAGNGVISGYSGDGSMADTSRIGGIGDVYVDDSDNVYLSANSNSRIFKVNAAGIISTISGNASGYLYNGDNIPATSANIDPTRIDVDRYGNVYIGEYHNYRVRQVDKYGNIYTLAGVGTAGFSGDGGAATTAQLFYPTGVTLDTCENLYIAEANNNRIRKVTYSKCHYLKLNEPDGKIDFNIRIFPNPTGNELTITAPEKISSVAITNIIGQTIVMETYNNKERVMVDVGHLPVGVYVVRVNERWVKKFVKE